MALVNGRSPDIEPRPLTERPRARVSQPLVLLVIAAVMALLAVVAGVVAAWVVFPEPTMWRIAINGLVTASAAVPIRALVRRASGRARRSVVADAEPEI